MNSTKIQVLFTALLFLVLILPACKSTKLPGESLNLKSKPSKFLLKKLSSNRVEAEWLFVKSRISYSDKNQSEKFTTIFQMRKDSLIWFNVKKTTVEALRVQITPDSFYLMDRLNKEYFIGSIEELENRFNLPQRTAEDISVFDMFQELLLGNPVFFAGSALESGIEGEEYTLKGKSEHFATEYRLEGLDYLLTAMNFVPDDGRQFLKIEMDRSETEKDYPEFSYFRTYKMNTPQQGDVEINIKFSKLELDSPRTIRFEIPKSYAPIN